MKVAALPVAGGPSTGAKPWELPDFTLKSYMDAVEKQILLDAIQSAGGKKNKAAQVLGLTRFALRHLIKKYGLEE